MSSNKLAMALPATGKKKSIKPIDNPFKMPADSEIFMLREKEKQQKLEDREKNKTLKVHEKLTHNQKLIEGMKAGLKPDISDDELGDDDDDIGNLSKYPVKEDRSWTIAVTRDRRIEKESLKDYINKKREMFLVQYSLGVKRDEMRKLEEIAVSEEKRIEAAEKYLEEDAALFDEFLKENGNNSTQAVKIAEEETRKKTEKSNEIKKLNTQIMILRSEINKMEDTLKEYQMYKNFLDRVTPQKVKESRLESRQTDPSRLSSAKSKATSNKSEQKSVKSEQTKNTDPHSEKTHQTGSHTKSSLSFGKVSITDGTTEMETRTVHEDIAESEHELEEEDEEDLELWFTDPQQLLDIFLELEEQNLSLIQNSQDTEEALEEMKQTISKTKLKMEKETEQLKKQINSLNDDIRAEVEKETDLKIKASYFSYGEFKQEDQDKMLIELNSKVEDVYTNCIGSNEANITTLQMLTNIENKLEDLFQKIEQMPPEKVEEAEKTKEKERRLRQREEKILEQKKNQEERIRKALERARAEPVKQTTRRLMARSKPPVEVKVDKRAQDEANKQDEELAYFFT